MGRYLNVLGVMAVSHSTKVLWMRTGRPLQRVTPNLHHNRKTNGAPGKRTNLCKSLPQRTVSVADIAAPCNGSKYPRSKFSIKRCITPNHHRICYHGLLSSVLSSAPRKPLSSYKRSVRQVHCSVTNAQSVTFRTDVKSFATLLA